MHYKVSIICGISEPRYSQSELAELNKRNAQTFDIDGKKMSGYDCTQAMRRLETEVRKQKDIRETARASGDNALVKKCNERIKAYKAKYTEISNITGIPEEPKRMSKPRMPKVDNNITSTGAKVLTNSGNGGIIKSNIEMFSKKTHIADNNRVPISKKRLEELTIEVRKMGATVIQCDYGDEMFNHLQSNDASASCIGSILLFRPDVTVSEVLEETFHFKQNLSKVNDDKPVKLRMILNEIEAKEYILNNSKKYSIPRTEIEETKVHLQKYKNELKYYYEEG